MRHQYKLFLFLLLASAITGLAQVRLVRVPNAGIQPQALLDERGTLHLIYFLGEAGGGDIFYVKRNADQSEFTKPLRVNSQTHTAIATGTIRGAQLALGQNGRVHIAWNGPHNAETREAAMFYARLNDARTAFEPQRNLMQFSGGLDGGGSVTADKAGNVYVAWHGRGDSPGEEHRRVWLARSTDGGKTFARETSAWNEPTGACGCCGLRAFADRQGSLHVLYRAATEKIHRDMYLISSNDQGRSFTGKRLDRWDINACPMSSEMMVDGTNGLLGAWENDGQVYFAALNDKQPQPIAAAGTPGKRKHPALATNARGETLFVWTEGTGWKKGGSFAWQRYDAQGQLLGERGEAQGIPVWSFAAAVAGKDGSFTIFY